MDERVLQFRVGVMVVSAMMITVALVVMLTDVASPFRAKKTIYIQFEEAPGVTVDTPIRKSGVLIGRVSGVTLIDKGVIITAKIDDRYTLRTNELCRISSETILGDAILEFVPVATKGDNVKKLEDGAYISGDVAANPLRAVEGLQDTFDSTAASFVQTSSEVAQAAATFNSMVTDNEEQLARVLLKAETAMTKAEAAMTQFETTMASIDSIVNDEELQAELKTALDEIPDLVTDARNAFQEIDKMAENFSEVADEADLTFQHATIFTKTLSEKGDGIVTDIESVADQMDTLLAELIVFSKNLNNSEGSVGQFVHNPELYQKLNRSADNIELLTRKMRPIVDDVRVFSDKIARDPGRLGLKGAITRGDSGTKHLPAAYYYYGDSHYVPESYLPAEPAHVPPATNAPQQFWNSQ